MEELERTAMPVLAMDMDIRQEDSTMIEITNQQALYGPFCRFLAANADVSSFVPLPKRSWLLDPLQLEEGQRRKELQRVSLGLGKFQFREFRIIHQLVGPPLGTSHGILQLRTLVVAVDGKGKRDALVQLVEEVEQWSASTAKKCFRTYMYSFQIQGWQHACLRYARPVASLVLPEQVEHIFTDVAHFLKPESYQWYLNHGIPYKRTYLLSGPPGTGKSSLIQVLAGVLGRNLCLLQPNHPKMTDDALTSCLLSAMRNSIIVLEDIDALFESRRQMAGRNTSLTFSGLLNALDGVATAAGQIYILTTNHVDRLDPALLRPGRVDRQFELKNVDADQVRRMFLQFYPGEDALAEEFVSELAAMSKLEGNERGKEGSLSPATLQSQFLTYSMCSAQEFLRCHDIR